MNKYFRELSVAGALLPRAGAWMVEIKHLFGMLLLGVALWTVQPCSTIRAIWPASRVKP